jgi:hypothetical protein
MLGGACATAEKIKKDAGDAGCLRRKMQIRNEEDQGSGNDATVLKI